MEAPLLWALEALLTAQGMELEPLAEAGDVLALDQEEPREARVLLRQQPPHAWLRHEVTAVAVREVALELAIRVLRVHAPTEDRLELLRAVRVRISAGQARAEAQTAADDAAVILDLVAADEQPIIRHTDDLHRAGGNQRAVEEARDAWQEVPLQLGDAAAPRQPLAQRERQAIRVVDVRDQRGYLRELLALGDVQQGGEDILVGRAAVVVGTPDRVRAHGECREEAQGQPTRPAQVRAAGQVHRAGTSLGDVSGSGGGAGRGRRRGGVVVSSGVGGRDVVVGLVVGLGDRGPDGLDLRETAGGDLRGRAARLRLPAEPRVDQ